jgi:protein TonB
VRTSLLISLALHAAAVLIFGLWICPWFDRMTPDRRGLVDLDVLVVGEKAKGGGESPHHEPKPPAARALPVPREAPKVVAPTPPTSPSDEPAAVVAAPQPGQAESVTIDDAGFGPRVVTVADYLRYVRDHNPAPSYPRLARLRGEQGRVVVRVVVPATGQLEKAEIEEGSGFDLLDRVALEAAKQWRYPPYRGENPSIAFTIPFRFTLD